MPVASMLVAYMPVVSLPIASMAMVSSAYCLYLFIINPVPVACMQLRPISLSVLWVTIHH